MIYVNLGKEWYIPQKTGMYFLHKDLNITYQAIENQIRISHVTCENICKTSFSQQNTHVPGWKENWDCFQLLSHEDIRKYKHILKNHIIKKKKLSWKRLNYEADFDASAKIIKCTIGTLNYHMCIACRKS